MYYLKCPRHRDRDITYFCKRCNKLACTDCECAKHDTISCRQYLNEEGYTKDKFNETPWELRERRNVYIKAKQLMKDMSAILERALDKMGENDISGRLELLLECVNQVKTELKEKQEASAVLKKALKRQSSWDIEEQLAFYTIETQNSAIRLEIERPYCPKRKESKYYRWCRAFVSCLMFIILAIISVRTLSFAVIQDNVNQAPEEDINESMTVTSSSSFYSGNENPRIRIIGKDVKNVKKNEFLSLTDLAAIVVDVRSTAHPEDCNFRMENERYCHVPVYRVDVDNPPPVSFPDTLFKTGYDIPVLLYSTTKETVPIGDQTLKTVGNKFDIKTVQLEAGTYTVEGTTFKVVDWGIENGYGVPSGAGEGRVKLKIPYGVYKVGKNQYRGNKSITSVYIPATVKVIEEGAFKGCKFLTDVKLMSGVRRINDDAFSGTGIMNLSIPGSVMVTGNGAFKNAKIQTLTLSEGLHKIGNSSFYDNKIASVCIPSTVTTIGKKAFASSIFASHPQINTVTFETDSQLTSIGNDAFYSTRLKSVTIPKSVRSIGSFTFYSTPLSSVTFEEGSVLASVGSYAFSKTKLTAITFPPSVKWFSWNIFSGAPITRIEAPGTAKFDKDFLSGIKTNCTVCFCNCSLAPGIKYYDNTRVETKNTSPIS